MTDLLIIGGGPAGLTCALYARRAGKTVLLLAPEGFGGQILYARSVENFPGFAAISGSDFSDRLAAQVLACGAEVLPEAALSVEQTCDGFSVTTEFGVYAARAVVVATGRKHRKLGVDGEDELVGNGVSYCALCDGSFYKGKDVAVVGGGSTALQDALYLSELCRTVTLIHRRDTFRGEAALAEQLKKRSNVLFLLSSTVTSLNGSPELTGVTVRHVTSGEEREVPVSGIFVAVGQESANDFLGDLADRDDQGYLIAGEDGVTSCLGLFAAGDCRRKKVCQLTTAAADGACAATSAVEYIAAKE